MPDGVAVRLSERDLSVRGRLPAGADPERISLGGGRVWIANTAARAVSSLDPGSGARRQVGLAAAPTAVAYRAGTVWAGVVPAPPPLPPVAGPELRISIPQPSLTLDPAFSHSTQDEQLEIATCANLLSYLDTGAARLRPEIAAAMPTVSPDGRTYTFRIRPGFRFSPPSNEAVTAATFKHSFERSFSPRAGLGSRGLSYAPPIVGLAAYRDGKAAHVSGIAARGDTLSITLVRPAGDFLTRISMPHLCPVPRTLGIGTHPAAGPIPSTGPYYVASDRDDRIVLLPNPGYAGSRPRRWARIVYTDDVPTTQAVADAQSGAIAVLPALDDDFSPLKPTNLLDQVYGPRSAAAKAGRQRFYETPSLFMDGIVLNTARPLFRSQRLRQAVNEALDRPTLARLYYDAPADQMIPPAVPGYPAGRFYPLDGPTLTPADSSARHPGQLSSTTAPAARSATHASARSRSSCARISPAWDAR